MGLWEESEGDAWWQRNRAALSDPGLPDRDPTLRMVERIISRSDMVLEVGCASGWRLNVIHERYGAECFGVDVSAEAIDYGQKCYTDLHLMHTEAYVTPYVPRLFDLVIMGFVLYVVERRYLAATIAEADRVLKPGGHLVITDFWPDTPRKRRNHHRPDVEDWVWKQDYAECFTALGTYREVVRQPYHHATLALGDCDPADRCAVVVLRKEETYLCESPSSATGVLANVTLGMP